MATQKFLPSVDERNPMMKDQVGNCIYEFVVEIVGQTKAPKITGMLINLPIEQIKQFMKSHDVLMMKVNEASQLLEQGMWKS